MVTRSRPPEPAALATELVAALEEVLGVARRLLSALDDGAGVVGTDPGPCSCGEACLTGGELPCCGALSRREAQVLGLLAAGRSNRDIARVLCLSPRTVQRHVANAYLKIGAHNKADATAYALRHGLA